MIWSNGTSKNAYGPQYEHVFMIGYIDAGQRVVRNSPLDSLTSTDQALESGILFHLGLLSVLKIKKAKHILIQNSTMFISLILLLRFSLFSFFIIYIKKTNI